MATTPEGKVKARIKKILKDYDVWYFMPVPSGYGGKSGIPDFVCLAKGQSIYIEAKAGDKRPTPLQDETMKEIRRHGGWALCVNEITIEHLAEWFELTLRLRKRKADEYDDTPDKIFVVKSNEVHKKDTAEAGE